MKKIKHLDELQLLKRGDVFKHGLFSLAGLLLLNALLYSAGIEWAPGKWAELTILLFTIMLVSIEFIFYGIFPLSEKRQRFLYYFCGLFGITAIIACVYDLMNEKTAIVTNGKIAESALGVIYGLMFLAIFLVYLFKSRYNVSHEENK
jgi:uncharacterized membrane protein